MKNLIPVIVLFFSISLFAQRSTFFDGEYAMVGGNQSMKIESTGGKYYKVYFFGDCNAETMEGSVDYRGVLKIPLVGGRSGDVLTIAKQRNQLSVETNALNVIRKSCGGYSIIGLYNPIGKNNRYDRYHEIQYERNYESHVNVNDLKGWGALRAYDELEARGFREVKNFSSSGKTYRVWYNHQTNQCVKTLSEHKKITQIMRSTHCN